MCLAVGRHQVTQIYLVPSATIGDRATPVSAALNPSFCEAKPTKLLDRINRPGESERAVAIISPVTIKTRPTSIIPRNKLL